MRQITFVSMIARYSASLYSSALFVTFVPTLLTSSDKRHVQVGDPVEHFQALLRAAPTSAANARISRSGNSSASSARASSRCASSRAIISTSAPSAASSRAQARPMPALAPVTSAVWPSRRQREGFVVIAELLRLQRCCGACLPATRSAQTLRRLAGDRHEIRLPLAVATLAVSRSRPVPRSKAPAESAASAAAAAAERPCSTRSSRRCRRPRTCRRSSTSRRRTWTRSSRTEGGGNRKAIARATRARGSLSGSEPRPIYQCRIAMRARAGLGCNAPQPDSSRDGT